MKRMLIKNYHFIIVNNFNIFSKTRLNTSPSQWKSITGFIQGTPKDFLPIHLFLGQANVSRLGMTLVIKTPVH